MKSLACFFIVVLMAVVPCFAINISAHSAILYEPSTKTVLFEKESRERRAIASTTKIMTALVVLENADIDDIVTVPSSCVGIEGTSMYLKEGEKLTVSDLLYGMLLQSGNDAAETLAYFVGNGEIPRFVEMMNETAKRLGLLDTNFKNPSGLPDEEHYSTAYDMAKLTAFALENDVFSEIVSTKSKTVAGRTLLNHNKLLQTYNSATGVKTGYTKVAGRCLVGSAQKDGMRLVAITLSAPDDWNDHKELFDFGFENFSLYKENVSDGYAGEVSVAGGESETVSVELAGDVEFLSRKGDKIDKVVYLPRFIYAPVSRGDVIGKIEYLKNGELIEIASLVSSDTVKEDKKPSFFEALFKIFIRN